MNEKGKPPPGMGMKGAEAAARTILGALGDKCAWLVAYPRSGVTFVRSILFHCFGIKTASVFIEAEAVGPGYAEAIGHIKLAGWRGEDGPIRDVLTAQPVLPAKCHGMPSRTPSGPPVILVVRDGRSVIESLSSFYPGYGPDEFGFGPLVRGENVWGSWSRWIDAWLRDSRKKLMVRYEDLVGNLSREQDRIAEFLGLSLKSRGMPSFAEFHRVNPRMFRRGRCDSRLPPDVEELFWKLHGGAMARLGYER